MNCICKTKMNQISGPNVELVMFEQEQKDPIEKECPNCGKEYSIRFFPKMRIHQRQHGTA